MDFGERWNGFFLLCFDCFDYSEGLNQKELQDGIPKAIEGQFIADLKEWRQVHSTENQPIKRIKFFEKVCMILLNFGSVKEVRLLYG